MNYTLSKLSYAYEDLEPFLDKRTMVLHHKMHHQTYVNNTNQILKNIKIDFKKRDIFDLIQNLDIISDRDIKRSLLNNAGGHANHTIFFQGLKLGTNLSQEMKKEISSHFNSVENFKKLFEETAISFFGSGWVWLVLKNSKLEIVSTVNQENPLMYNNSANFYYPIFGIDLWEHSYYLKYQNRKKEYIQSFWNILSWEEAEKRFTTGIKLIRKKINDN
ncbi:Fe-Mn family superoxide dismutase [Candidatus Riesia pediculischaeffi]|uniref:Superoxide dismutase n=1 Tax=Candidatus Riesia pediculischaeffi PTSU TaxID=1401651 RepID=A0A0C1V727_9ENTR|nr:Fe-Mn family superoxide dismutase [Candidatus Riesia pediculischaeffi]KIE64229.1 Manganese superoxide dismutase [Candidatus Riesia pediculischaeffi PTSU]